MLYQRSAQRTPPRPESAIATATEDRADGRAITLVSLPLMIYVAVLFCHWAGPV